MRPIRIFALMLVAGMLALASCDSTPLESGSPDEVEDPGFLLHLEFHPLPPGEDLLGTMWILLRGDYGIDSFADRHQENPEVMGEITGLVRPGPGVDPDWQFHFDPDTAIFWWAGHPNDRSRYEGTLPELEQEVLAGERTHVAINRIRVLEVLPEGVEPPET